MQRSLIGKENIFHFPIAIIQYVFLWPLNMRQSYRSFLMNTKWKNVLLKQTEKLCAIQILHRQETEGLTWKVTRYSVGHSFLFECYLPIKNDSVTHNFVSVHSMCRRPLRNIIFFFLCLYIAVGDLTWPLFRS